jgi:hypothetical protein
MPTACRAALTATSRRVLIVYILRSCGYRDGTDTGGSFRKSLEVPKGAFSGKWNSLAVQFVSNPAMKPLEGKSLREIMRERGRSNRYLVRLGTRG